MSNASTGRRSFLDLLLKGGLAVWTASMLAPVLAYVWPARSQGGRASSVSAGAIKDFPAGSGKIVQVEGKPVLVIRKNETEFAAFTAICTHLGCIVKWDAASKQIQCPCHAAVFNADGQVVAGPPPRPLDPFEVLAAGGEVLIKV